jgi:hypothetical protein
MEHSRLYMTTATVSFVGRSFSQPRTGPQNVLMTRISLKSWPQRVRVVKDSPTLLYFKRFLKIASTYSRSKAQKIQQCFKSTPPSTP